MFDLLMLMAHKQCCVIVTLNKRRHTIDIEVFDMFSVMLTHSTFSKTMTPLVEAVFVNETQFKKLLTTWPT